jgi:hypothetical protein
MDIINVLTLAATGLALLIVIVAAWVSLRIGLDGIR